MMMKAAMVTVKITVRQQVSDTVPCTIVKQQATQYAGFGLNRVGGNTQLGNLGIMAVVIDHRRGK